MQLRKLPIAGPKSSGVQSYHPETRACGDVLVDPASSFLQPKLRYKVYD